METKSRMFIIISDFNQNMTRKLLDEIIMKVEALGFRIHGITFDLGNKTFLSQVGFNAGNYSIPNPIDPENRKIYLFPGILHFLFYNLRSIFLVRTRLKWLNSRIAPCLLSRKIVLKSETPSIEFTLSFLIRYLSRIANLLRDH